MIRLLTYNVHGSKDTKGDYRPFNDLFVEQQIDIALLQEVDTRPANRSTEQDIANLCGTHFTSFFPAKSIETSDGWYGNAILSRYPLEKKEVVDITVGQREPRTIQESFITTPDGPLHIINTHKGLGRMERRRQLARLGQMLERESETPLIVGGDINEWHAYARPLRALNKYLHPYPAGATFPTFMPLFHLDRLWSRPPHLIHSVRVLKNAQTRRLSDHYPIMAEIDLP